MALRALTVLALASLASIAFVEVACAQQSVKKKGVLEEGKELFHHEWQPRDARSHGGDGLGPMFNARSCVACHRQGGSGGAGGSEHDVELLTAVAQVAPAAAKPEEAQQQRRRRQKAEVRELSVLEKRYLAFAQRGELVKLHPEFSSTRTVVWHRQSTREDYASWCKDRLGLPNAVNGALSIIGQSEPPTVASRTTMGNCVAPLPEGKRPQPGGFVFESSRRSTPALFGAGRIDAIPENVIVKAAAKRYANFPEISGRVARLDGGKIGRFGWKGQVPTLKHFVLQACAVEIGLDVPGRSQPTPAWQPDYKPKGYDMDKSECDSLIAYVGELPEPTRSRRDSATAHGERLFGKIGCAACHSAKLGSVVGIFSDLLLHDMGASLLDSASGYGGGPSRSPGIDEPPNIAVHDPLPDPNATTQASLRAGTEPQRPDTPSIGAGNNEWRTPPLWGVAASAPYMHDGRATSLEAAIAAHDGEARRSALRFSKLTQVEQNHVIAFLHSLAAP